MSLQVLPSGANEQVVPDDDDHDLHEMASF